MRDDWTETSLGEIAALSMGRTPSRSDKTYWTEDLAYPFCTIADMDEKFIFPKREGVTIKAIQDGKAKIALTGTLLMSFKLTIGRMGFAGRDIFPNEAIVSITPDPALAIDMFLYYLLGFQDLTAGSGRAIKGETLNSKSLSAIPIFLPPLAEQKRIVDVVSSVDVYIDALQQQVDSARTARNAVLHELLSAGGDDWTETTLGEIITLEYGKPLKAENRDGKGFPVFGSAGEVGLHSEPLVNEAPVIVVGRKGTAGAVWWSDLPCSVIDTAYYVVQKVETDIRFLYFILGYLDLPSLTAQTGVPGLNRDRAYSSRVLLPLLDEQKRIVGIVSSMDEMIQSIDQAVEDAKNLRSGLLSDLLSGEHEIPASYDVFVGAA